MTERRPTILDVARKAGVSKSTVSLVLQGSPLVKPETRERARAAMSEIGYIYNRSAANLRAGGAGLVGLVINDLRNPFFTEFAASAQMALSARGYAAVLANTDEDPVIQAQVVAAMIEHGVSALILSPAYGLEDETFGLIARSGLPAIQVLRRAGEAALCPFAAPDYETGGRLAAEHLLEGGARRIAFLGGLEGRDVTRRRMAGYLAALEAAGMEPLVLPGRPSRAWGRETAALLARDHPDVDAVLCFNDLVALGLMAELARRGARLKVVGFDDIEECADSWPALSSVRCDVAGFGRLMAETALAWLEEGRRPPPETLTPVSLIARESSGAPDQCGKPRLGA